MQSLPRNGAMAAVFAGEDRVRAAIAPYSKSVSIAAINSPLNTVISGKTDDVRAVLERLAHEGMEAKPLAVSHAFHSPLVAPILDEFEQFARSVEHRAPIVDLLSNVTGRPCSEALPLDAGYWRRHARETVRFAESIRNLHTRGIRAFLEIGPAPVLINMARQCVEGSETTWLASLRKDRDEWPQMLSSLGALFVLGAKPDWDVYDQAHRRRRVTLPTYPFQRKRHWLPAGSPTDSTRQRTQAAGHPLLGVHVPLAGRPGEHVWFGEISLERCPWIDDHRVQGEAVVPATAYIEMAIAAVVEAGSELPVVLTRIEIEKVLLLQPAIEFEIQTRLEQQIGGVMAFQMHSRRKTAKGDWTLHASGALRADGIAVPMAKFDASQRDAFAKQSTACLEGSEFYRLHNQRGNQWGPSFQGVTRAWQSQGEALSEVAVAVGIQGDLSRYVFHPAFSDSLGHILTATIPLEKSDGTLGGAFVGAGIEELRVYQRPEGELFYALAKLRSNETAPDNTLVGDVKVFDFSGSLITETIGARLWYLDSAQKHHVLESVDDLFYEPRWVPKETTPDELGPEGWTTGTWIVFRDRQGIGDAVCAQLRQNGATCLCVDHGKANEALTTIRPDDADDYDGLLRAAARQGSVVKGIVHLWSLDASDPEKANFGDVQEAQTLGPISVLRMVQALDRAQQPTPPKLWLISRGAQPADDKALPLALLQSPLWGLGRTIAMESGDFWGGQVDLDPSDTPEVAATLLLRQLVERGGEDQTAFRNGRRLVLRLARRTKTMSRPERVPIRPDATSAMTTGASPRQIYEPVQLEVSKPGILENLRWSPVERAAPGPGEVEIQVQVTGLNFRDVLCTLGMYPGEFGALGAECAGVVTRTGEGVEKLEPGDKVMAVARGGFSNLRDPACRPCCSPARWGVTCRGSVDSSRLPHGILRFASFGSYESRRSGAHSCRGRWRGTGRCPTGAAGRRRNLRDGGKPRKTKPFADARRSSRFRLSFFGFRG